MLQGLLLGHRQGILRIPAVHALHKQLQHVVHQLPVLTIGRAPAAPHL